MCATASSSTWRRSRNKRGTPGKKPRGVVAASRRTKLPYPALFSTRRLALGIFRAFQRYLICLTVKTGMPASRNSCMAGRGRTRRVLPLILRSIHQTLSRTGVGPSGSDPGSFPGWRTVYVGPPPQVGLAQRNPTNAAPAAGRTSAPAHPPITIRPASPIPHPRLKSSSLVNFSFLASKNGIK